MNDSDSKFVKPTIRQLNEYIQKFRFAVVAEEFFDWYEASQWMCGPYKHMTSWKGTLKNWHLNELEEIQEIAHTSIVEIGNESDFTNFLIKKCQDVDDYYLRIAYRDYSEGHLWFRFPLWKDYMDFFIEDRKLTLRC